MINAVGAGTEVTVYVEPKREDENRSYSFMDMPHYNFAWGHKATMSYSEFLTQYDAAKT